MAAGTILAAYAVSIAGRSDEGVDCKPTRDSNSVGASRNHVRAGRCRSRPRIRCELTPGANLFISVCACSTRAGVLMLILAPSVTWPWDSNGEREVNSLWSINGKSKLLKLRDHPPGCAGLLISCDDPSIRICGCARVRLRIRHRHKWLCFSDKVTCEWHERSV